MISILVVFLAGAAAAAPPKPELRPATPVRDRSQAYYHFSLGLQARLMGDTEAALAEYRRAAKLDPASAVIRVEAARLLRDSGRFEEALVEAKQAVALEPDHADAHLILGQLYQSQSDGSAGDEAVRLAAAEFEEVVRLQPNDLMTLQSLAALHAQLQRPLEAARAWERYLEIDPGSFDAHVQLGAQLLAAGESERAAGRCKKRLSSSRRPPALMRSWARSTRARSRSTSRS